MGDVRPKSVTVIVPAYNDAETLRACLVACLTQTLEPERVIVVDDGSTDNTPEVAHALPVQYIHQENRGPAAARNRGAALAETGIIAFTDADCVPRPDWLERLVDAFEGGAIAIGGAYDNAAPNRVLPCLVHEEIRIRHARLPREVDFLGSFNVAYRKDAFDAAGGFDESFPHASAEDNDLAYRLQDAGGKLVFDPTVRVAHHHPSNIGPYLRAQMRHGYWRMKLYAKHPGRGRGDNYAGPLDFAGPPLALVVLAGIVAIPFVDHNAFSVLVALLAAGYGLISFPMDRAMIARLGLRHAIAYRAMTALRDVARGIGLVRGAWRFLILRRDASA